MRKYIDALGFLTESRVKQIDLFLNQPPLTVLINPVQEQIKNLLSKLQYKVLRGHLDNRLLVWDGGFATHDHIDDSGEFGHLDGIRFTYSETTLRLMPYGRDGAAYPYNYETYEDFQSPEEMLEATKESELLKRAFGNFTPRI